MRLFWRLLNYFRPYVGRTVVAAVLLAISGVLMTAVVSTVKPLTDQVFLPAVTDAAPVPRQSSGPDILQTVTEWLPLESWAAWLRERAFVTVPLLIVVISFVRAVFLYFGQYWTTKVGARIIRDLRAELYESITYQSQRFFQAHPTGVILSRVVSDVQRVQRMAGPVLADLFRVGAMAPFLLALIFYQSWRMALFSVVALPMLGYPMVRLGRRLRRAATRSQETMAEAASLMSEAVTGSRVVQGFGMERFEIGRFRATLERMLRMDLKAGRAAALAPATMDFLGTVIGALLFLYAGLSIARGYLTAGDFMVVLAGTGLLFMSVRRLNTVNVEIQHALSAAARVFEMMDREREIKDAPDATLLPPFAGEIRFEGVGFAYEEQQVLERIDLTIRRGEVVALVGASGSGKTTLASLLPRFYDPTEGSLALDGHDIRNVTLASLREQIGLVTQETVLFDDTVRNNIAYGRSDVPMEKVEAAARAANADTFIRETPDGYATMLGERGTRLSVGQRQRIAIARALLKDPPILVLDEATSALDAESEALVQDALERLMVGRTSIVIAHRLATVRRADRIVVLDAGRIVEEGSHEELLQRGGTYARLHDLQFQDT